jgi:hypothetical protein
MESQKRYGGGQGQGDDNRPEKFSGNGGDILAAESGPKQRSGKVLNCPDCGKQVKNLGAHKRFCKAKNIEIDDYLGKSLSFTLESIRQVLKAVKYELTTTVVDTNGDYSSLELKIRIPLRR